MGNHHRGLNNPGYGVYDIPALTVTVAEPLIRAVAKELHTGKVMIRYSLTAGVEIFVDGYGSWRVRHPEFRTVLGVVEDAWARGDIEMLVQGDKEQVEGYLSRYFPQD